MPSFMTLNSDLLCIINWYLSAKEKNRKSHILSQLLCIICRCYLAIQCLMAKGRKRWDTLNSMGSFSLLLFELTWLASIEETHISHKLKITLKQLHQLVLTKFTYTSLRLTIPCNNINIASVVCLCCCCLWAI